MGLVILSSNQPVGQAQRHLEGAEQGDAESQDILVVAVPRPSRKPGRFPGQTLGPQHDVAGQIIGVVVGQLERDLIAFLQVRLRVGVGGEEVAGGNVAAVALHLLGVELHLLVQRQVEEPLGLTDQLVDPAPRDAVVDEVEEADMTAGAPRSRPPRARGPPCRRRGRGRCRFAGMLSKSTSRPSIVSVFCKADTAAMKRILRSVGRIVNKRAPAGKPEVSGGDRPPTVCPMRTPPADAS